MVGESGYLVAAAALPNADCDALDAVLQHGVSGGAEVKFVGEKGHARVAKTKTRGAEEITRTAECKGTKQGSGGINVCTRRGLARHERTRKQTATHAR